MSIRTNGYSWREREPNQRFRGALWFFSRCARRVYLHRSSSRAETSEKYDCSHKKCPVVGDVLRIEASAKVWIGQGMTLLWRHKNDYHVIAIMTSPMRLLHIILMCDVTITPTAVASTPRRSRRLWPDRIIVIRELIFILFINRCWIIQNSTAAVMFSSVPQFFSSYLSRWMRMSPWTFVSGCIHRLLH